VIVDLRSIPAGTTLEADVCIVGGGAAGITLARALASSLSVLLAESGGHALEPDTQALYGGRNIGLPYYALDATRLRYLGGTTNHWAGWCSPLTALDLGPRPWAGIEGWPISLDALGPYYRQAQQVLELGPFTYGDEIWQRLDVSPPLLDPQQLEHRFWQFSPPTVFGQRYRSDLERKPNLTTVLHASAVSLATTPNADHVQSVRLRSLDGSDRVASARVVVVACGGIETPRLLLASNAVQREGLGNGNDLVGRFFMDHPEVDAGVLSLVPKAMPAFVDTYLVNDAGGFRCQPGICPTDAFQRRMRILNCALALDFEVDPWADGTAQLRRIGDLLGNGELPDRLGDRLWSIMTDSSMVVRNVYRRFVEGRSPLPSPAALRKFFLYARCEQSPNPESRVRLGTERDALGMCRVVLDWRLRPIDKATLRTVVRTLGRELGRLELGRVQLPAWLLNDDPADWGEIPRGGHHHIGTTRMSADHGDGVVNPDCRLHTVDNLYVASSAVFPTAGAANPTLTIVALALRLADHLNRRLNGSP
jgi:choline dehydrogenase-like flavoprotein